MKRVVISLAWLITLPLYSASQSTGSNAFTYGSQNGAAVGNDLISIYGAIGHFERKLNKKIFKRYRWIDQLGRLGRCYLFYATLANLVQIVQHEYGGHYLRAKEWEADARWVINTRYFLAGTYSGSVSYDSRGIDFEQEILITASGMNSTNYISESVKVNMIKAGEMRYHESMLFFVNKIDLVGYTFYGDGDVASYENDLITILDGDYDLVRTWLKTSSFYSFFDPFVGFSLYNVMSYVFDRKPITELPAFTISDSYSLIPNVNTQYSPLGPELHFGFFHKFENVVLNSSIRYTPASFFRNQGINFEIYDLNDHKHPIPTTSVQVALWEQATYDTLYTEFSTGMQLGLTMNWALLRLGEGSALGLTANTYYKTKGFNSAYPFEEGFYMQVGFYYAGR